MSDFFRSAPPRVLAHRGFALQFAENTLAAFAAAVDAGCVYIETDVRATKDGAAVLFHDADLQRLTGSGQKVAALSLDGLQRIDLGNGHHVPTLREALDAFPYAKFNIDVKDARAIVPTADAVVAAGATKRVLITSFSDSRRRRTVRLLPGVATSAAVSRFILALVGAKIGWSGLIRFALRGTDAVQVPEQHYGISITIERTVRRLRAAGVEMHVWAINDAASMERLLDLGVDGIVTDRPDIALALINRRRHQR